MLISLGTYITAITHGEKNIKDSKNFWPFQASIPGHYLYECMGVRRGMWTISWFCNQFGEAVAQQARDQGLTVEEMFNLEAEKIPAGSEGLITIHDWAPPADAVFRKGIFFGFDGRHNRAHIYRSILEGIALTMKNHVNKMMTELETPLTNLIISGGGSHSNVFMQIFADVFGVPAQRNQIKDAASLGCAINAAMAVNAFDSYEQAVKQMVHQADSFVPNNEHTELYNQINDHVYQHAHTHFDPLLQKLSKWADT